MKTKQEKLTAVLGGALLLVLMLAAYSNHFRNGFHMDDGHSIVDNPAIRELRNIPAFFRDPTTFSVLPSNQSYRPLVSTVLALDYRVGHGLQPLWFHLSSFAFFVVLTLLLAFVLSRMLGSDSALTTQRWIALPAAACYALNPTNADTLNYITASSEVISTLGVMASFAVYFAFPRLRRWYLFVLPAALAILAKPTAAIFPVLFALFRTLFAPSARTSRAPAKLFVEIVPPFLICGAVMAFVQHMTPRTWVAGAVNPHGYLLAQPYVALFYFKTFFCPVGLNADYDLQPFASINDVRVWIGFGFVIALTLAAIAAIFKGPRLIGFGLLWFLIGLLPTSFFPLAEVMNDHRAFLSNIGLVFALAGAGALLCARLWQAGRWMKRATAFVVALVLGASACATYQRNKVWRSEETLWHDVVLKSPQNARGLMTYGITLVNHGKFSEALDHLRRARQLAPPYSLLSINLAIAEDATGASQVAQEHFKEALRLAPLSPDSYTYYARYLLEHSRPQEARPLLHRALELTPSNQTARRLLQETETDKAQAEMLAADALLREAKIGEAITHYESALKIAPDSTATLNNLAWVLATAPDASFRDGAKALELAEKADRLSGGRSPIFLRTLAAAYAENARFDDATRAADRALQAAMAQSDLALATKLQKDLAYYRHRHPLHP